jgi:FixJ family two-component response regulator
VDPNPDMCDSLRSLLDQLDLPVETYPNGEHLFEKGSLTSPGCVVTEARLPGKIRGTEIAQRLLRRGLELPVIVISPAGDVPIAVEQARPRPRPLPIPLGFLYGLPRHQSAPGPPEMEEP